MEEQRRRSENIKVGLSVILSQIMYARDGLKPECFRKLPEGELESASETYADVIHSGRSLHTKNDQYLLSPNSTIIFRRPKKRPEQHVDYFVNLLERDIFPQVETERLESLQVCFLNDKEWADDALVEYFKLGFSYDSGRPPLCQLAWAGISQSRPHPSSGNADNAIGNFLAHLRPIEGPVFSTTFAFFRDGRQRKLSHAWNFDCDIAAAQARLAGLPNFRQVEVCKVLLGDRTERIVEPPSTSQLLLKRALLEEPKAAPRRLEKQIFSDKANSHSTSSVLQSEASRQEKDAWTRRVCQAHETTSGRKPARGDEF